MRIFTLALSEAQAASPDDDQPVQWEPYNGKGMAGVFTFTRNRKKIQVVACKFCPMFVILGFHFTCVLNVISHSHAYLIYPRTMFHGRGSIMLPRMLSEHEHIEQTYEAALEKYKSRDFSMTSGPSVVDFLRAGEYRRERCVGDSACWIIPSSEIPGLDQHFMSLDLDPVRGNSWTQYNKFGSLYINYDVGRARNFKTWYTYSQPIPRMTVTATVRAENDIANDFHFENEYSRLVHEAYEKRPRQKLSTTDRLFLLSMMRKEDVQVPAGQTARRVIREFPNIPYRELPNMNTMHALGRALTNLEESLPSRCRVEHDIGFLETPNHSSKMSIQTRVTARITDHRHYSILTFPCTNQSYIDKLAHVNIVFVIEGLPGDAAKKRLRRDQRSVGLMVTGPDADSQLELVDHSRMQKIPISPSGTPPQLVGIDTTLPINFVALMQQLQQVNAQQ
ncbi:hypothetical protein D9758_010362 [Tetrapyrgos nigripes]|uniref:Uncharacterized protein n=1 Tax=Tetrapyrgos nigripes TaxID=182062 RepID=A0A8H5FW14_9AGAR|nr:hypothetical protein D9758_010362 [Tetrapyrgos nigripes]